MDDLLRFRDQIKKEMKAVAKHAKTQRTFNLDPTALKPVTKKIGEAGTKLTEAEMTLKQNNISLVQETIRLKNRLPQDKYEVAPTSSAEVGWLAAKYTSLSKPYQVFTHVKSDVAEYGELYVKTMKAGPYDKTQPVAR